MSPDIGYPVVSVSNDRQVVQNEYIAHSDIIQKDENQNEAKGLPGFLQRSFGLENEPTPAASTSILLAVLCSCCCCASIFGFCFFIYYQDMKHKQRAKEVQSAPKKEFVPEW